ncbi:undecaprenyl diphosphate synthase family protein [Nonomuraea sp. NPDC049129]|uniref:undecaprenyl diphosphate synthase family protein n=1 Tax=Nonomuraea sp. NPDC049129 TaxID=3155272 RepID=UPI0033ED7DA2
MRLARTLSGPWQQIGSRLFQRPFPPEVAPRHVGVVLDDLSDEGVASNIWPHRRRGSKRDGLLTLVECCQRAGVEYVTFWRSSTPAGSDLPRRWATDHLCREVFAALQARLAIDVHTVGAADERQILAADGLGPRTAASQKGGSSRLRVTFAAGDSGKKEVADALRRWLAVHRNYRGALDQLASHLTARALLEHSEVADLPPLDLIIRTSGQRRAPGFLLLHSAYAELYFTGVHWSRLRVRDVWKALSSYAARQRRFGR